jgi:hypothetical protein
MSITAAIIMYYLYGAYCFGLGYWIARGRSPDKTP